MAVVMFEEHGQGTWLKVNCVCGVSTGAVQPVKLLQALRLWVVQRLAGMLVSKDGDSLEARGVDNIAIEQATLRAGTPASTAVHTTP
jgi:hypothetical protein